jgi:CubicO group peptidase (beta-lactamase class C family)
VATVAARRASIDRVFSSAVDRGDLVCAAGFAGDRDGVFHECAFGTSSSDSDTPISTDTVFAVASMVKAITSVAAMRLVEQGTLELDSPVGDLAPELAAPRVLAGFSESGEPMLRPARRAITLRHLLTHTAGFTYEVWNADMLRYQRQNRIPTVSLLRKETLGIPLVFDPGDRFEYGISTDWIGIIIERVTGDSLRKYVLDNILGPLGMTNTDFLVNDRSRLPSVERRNPDGSLTPRALVYPEEPEFTGGGTNIYTTGADYLKFLRALLRGGELDGVRLLRADTVAEMARNQIGDLVIPVFKTQAPSFAGDVEFFPSTTQKWGLGFLINTEPGQAGRAAGSLAWGGLANTFYWVDLHNGVAGVFLTQLIPFCDPKALAVYAEFENAVYTAVHPDAQPGDRSSSSPGNGQ